MPENRKLTAGMRIVFSLCYHSSPSFLSLSFCLTKGNYEDGIYKIFFFLNKFLSLHEIPPNNSTRVFWKVWHSCKKERKEWLSGTGFSSGSPASTSVTLV